MALRALFEARPECLRRPGLGPILLAGAMAMGLGGAGLWAWWTAEDGGWQALELFSGAVLFLVAVLVGVAWRRTGPWASAIGRLAGDHHWVLTPAGIAMARPADPEFVPWSEISGFVESEDYWIFQHPAPFGSPVPKAALPDFPEQEAFADRVLMLWAAHPANRGRVLAKTGGVHRSHRQVWVDLGNNLLAGYRFAVFRPSEANEFRANATQLALLLVLQLVAILAGDYLTASPDSAFDFHGFNDYGATTSLFLLGGVVIGNLLGQGKKLLHLLVVLAAADTVTFTIYLLLDSGTRLAGFEEDWMLLTGLYGIWIVWNLALVFRAVTGLYEYPRVLALPAVGVFALFTLVLAHALPPESFFAPSGGDAATLAESQVIDGEDIIYRQPELLGEAIDSLAVDRPGITDLYFVGFAGDAEEQVFAHEIEYARDLFDRRFGTSGRSVALVNSRDTADRLALASSHSLELVLQAVADRMNPDEDVLFLFLASHGSADHRLSVQFSPLPLDDLSATGLKDLLDRSGIRHRVIVVSACYSGGFLDVLKDEDSLILTAASRDHTSFGCGTESEFTYFGQAYFAEALQSSRSFIDAFDQARSWIEDREKREGKEPSLPQRYVGESILPKLRSLEATLLSKS